MKCRICRKRNRMKSRRICKKCLNTRSKRWRLANLEKHRSRINQWRKANPLKLRRYNLKHNYKLSKNDIDKVMAWKKGRCPGCGKKLTKFGVGLNDACMDHNHSNNKLRGIICGACNRVLGFAKDKVQTLNNLVDYLNGELPLSYIP